MPACYRSRVRRASVLGYGATAAGVPGGEVLRIVPRFERPLRDPTNTYASGAAIARDLDALDALAASSGLRTLRSFGLVAANAPEGADSWWDSRELASVAETLARMVEGAQSPFGRDSPEEPIAARARNPYRDPAVLHDLAHETSRVAQELLLIRDAAVRAAAEGAGCRLVVRTSTSMKYEMWAQLRDAGY